MVDIDGMVSRLMQLMQDANMATALGCRSEYSQTELILVDCLRTTESENNASRLDFLKSYGVESCISFESIAKGFLVFGKSRRIENNEVVIIAGALQIAESIFGKCVMTCITGEIQFCIGSREIDSF